MKKVIIYILFITTLGLYSSIAQEANTTRLLQLSEKYDSIFAAQMTRVLEKLQTSRIDEILPQYIFGLSTTDQILYFTEHNVNSAKTTSTDRIQLGGSLGLDLTGRGMTVGVWEVNQPLLTHQEYSGRITLKDNGYLSSHATHVNATIIGSGIDRDARGMAPEASSVSYSSNNYLAEIAAEAANGLLISNHSYGLTRGWLGGRWYGDTNISRSEDYLFGFYADHTKIADELAFNAPYHLIVQSAGNDRSDTGFGHDPDGPYDCIGSQVVAKNILTVGAVADIAAGYESSTDVVITSFSSWGPTDDGRIKPDIVANGSFLYSASAASDDAYTSFSGTSMSAPSASGTLLLLQELHFQRYGSYLKSASLKGLIINTADEAGNADGPDYSFGWGLLNAEKAALFITKKANEKIIFNERTLTDGNSYQTTIESDGNSPIVATICWTDPAGTPVDASLNPTDLMLVNDLNIKITASDGNTEYFPWILNPSSVGAAATKGVNMRDNVEKVEIPDPVAGIYTIEISHINGLVNSAQDFTLLVNSIPLEEDFKTYYWVGGTGDWSDVSHWSLTSGGTLAGELPGADDRVIINEDSFSSNNQVITLDTDLEVNSIELRSGNLKMSGITLKIAKLIVSSTTGDKTLNISNSLLIGLEEINLSGINLSYEGENTIINYKTDFSGPGNLLINGQELNSVITDNTVLIVRGNGSFGSFKASGDITFRDGFTFDSMDLEKGSTIRFGSGTTHIIENIKVNSDDSNPIVLTATGEFNASLIGEANERYCLDYLTISNVDVPGDAWFVSGTNSTVTNSAGWIQDDCENFLFAEFSSQFSCSGGIVDFLDESTGNPVKWEWYFDDVASGIANLSTLQNPTHVFNLSGTYDVRLTVFDSENNELVTEYSVQIEEGTLPKPEIQFFPPLLISTVSANNYQWWKDGNLLVDENLNQLQNPASGAYQVEVWTDDCKKISDSFIILGEDNEVEKFKTVIYPNPFDENITIHVDMNPSGRSNVLRIFDLKGKLVRKKRLNKELITINTKGWKPGIYLFQIETPMHIRTQKILKR